MKQPSKPAAIWPIWVIGGIFWLLFIILGVARNWPQMFLTSIQTGILIGCIIATSMLHSRNKKLFGKDYRANPKWK